MTSTADVVSAVAPPGIDLSRKTPRGFTVEVAYGHRRFATQGEASAAERGWHDASRGWGAIEKSAAYIKGYFDRIDYDDHRADTKREQFEEATHDELED